MGYQALVQELTSHLIDQGLTLKAEAGDPVVVRPVKADLLLNTLVDYMIGAGYASTTRIH
jgi:hypothetical protein